MPGGGFFDRRAFSRRADNLLGVVLAHFELEEEVLFPVLDRTMSAFSGRALAPARELERSADAGGECPVARRKVVFADGALTRKVKQLIAVAVAHSTQCPYCIRGHTLGALRDGATDREIMEAIWVAAEMRAGGAFAHSVIALAAVAGKAQHTP